MGVTTELLNLQCKNCGNLFDRQIIENLKIGDTLECANCRRWSVLSLSEKSVQSDLTKITELFEGQNELIISLIGEVGARYGKGYGSATADADENMPTPLPQPKKQPAVKTPGFSYFDAERLAATDFSNKIQYKKIILTEDVNEIPVRKFEHCYNLEEVVFEGSGEILIRAQAFAGCKKLARIICKNGVLNVAASAFDNVAHQVSVIDKAHKKGRKA